MKIGDVGEIIVISMCALGLLILYPMVTNSHKESQIKRKQQAEAQVVNKRNELRLAFETGYDACLVDMAELVEAGDMANLNNCIRIKMKRVEARIQD